MSRKTKTVERFRILVVDDHDSAREAVADVLRHALYDGQLTLGQLRRPRDF